MLMGCRKDPDVSGTGAEPMFALELPPGFPAPPLNTDNPLTQASVELGRKLFFERRLSKDALISCGSCHIPERAFSDTVPLSIGVHGTVGLRNSPTLANLAYHPAFFRDGGVPDLEIQVLAPIHDPVEMDFDIHAAALLLKDEEPYAELSMRAYERELDGFVITRAIANYERTLISGWSRYDAFRYQNDASALSPEEVRGWQVFSGPEANCIACHNGPDLSDHSYRNIGLYLNYADEGRQRISLRPEDNGKFKVPTLRNIALTAPYMHDGSLPTLEAVVDHFSSGGVGHPNTDPLIGAFSLTAQERLDLLAFLRALTDDRTLDQVK